MAWTTPIDRVFNQKVFFYIFVGIVVGTTVLTLLSDSPIGNPGSLKEQGPVGNDPENWSINDLKWWLKQRDIHFDAHELRNDLVRRVQGAMKASTKREENRIEEGSTSGTSQGTEEIELKDLSKSVKAE